MGCCASVPQDAKSDRRSRHPTRSPKEKRTPQNTHSPLRTSKRVSPTGFVILPDVLHTDVINDIATTDICGEIFTACDDKTVKRFNFWTREQHTYVGPTKGVTRVLFAPRTHRIYAACRDGNIYSWPVDRPKLGAPAESKDNKENKTETEKSEGEALSVGETTTANANQGKSTDPFVFRGHSLAVQAIALSEDEMLLASGGRDGTVRVWDTRTGTELLHGYVSQNIVTGVAWLPTQSSRDGKPEAKRWLLQVGEDLTCKLWPVDLVHQGVVHSSQSAAERGLSPDIYHIVEDAVLPAVIHPFASLTGSASIPHRLVHAPRIVVPTEVQGTTPTFESARLVQQALARQTGRDAFPDYKLLEDMREDLHPCDVFFVSHNGFQNQGCDLTMWSTPLMDSLVDASSINSGHPSSPKHGEAIRGLTIVEDLRRPEDADTANGGDAGMLVVASSSVDGVINLWSFLSPPHAQPAVSFLTQTRLPLEQIFLSEALASSAVDASRLSANYRTSSMITRRLISTCLASNLVQRVRPGVVTSTVADTPPEWISRINEKISFAINESGIPYFPNLSTEDGQQDYKLQPTDSLLYTATQQGNVLVWLVTRDETSQGRLIIPLYATSIDI